MDFKEAIQKIMDNAEKTLDKITGETPESRAAAKEKMRKFFSDLLNRSEKAKSEDKKDEKNC
ncbi:hypothetical protein [Nitrosophilus labii]|uniref:hypothetical protein n=1 Tax=Nitrosophilus labii TaxID=2706014 RepID=UPI0016569465|nr:hypothetical protein [Nitrosophilus labii]